MAHMIKGPDKSRTRTGPLPATNRLIPVGCYPRARSRGILIRIPAGAPA
ncbi:hypothetical protein JCM9957A_65810 [Kineosporia succinea]